MLLEPALENLHSLVKLSFPAKVLAEFEEDPGGGVLPDLKTELLESIVHGIVMLPPAFRRQLQNYDPLPLSETDVT